MRAKKTKKLNSGNIGVWVEVEAFFLLIWTNVAREVDFKWVCVGGGSVVVVDICNCVFFAYYIFQIGEGVW